MYSKQHEKKQNSNIRHKVTTIKSTKYLDSKYSKYLIAIAMMQHAFVLKFDHLWFSLLPCLSLNAKVPQKM